MSEISEAICKESLFEAVDIKRPPCHQFHGTSSFCHTFSTRAFTVRLGSQHKEVIVDLEILKKKISTFRGDGGRVRITDESLLMEILSAWEQWTGPCSGVEIVWDSGKLII